MCMFVHIRYERTGKEDSLRGSSVKLGTMRRILEWTLRKDDTRKAGSVHTFRYEPAGKD